MNLLFTPVVCRRIANLLCLSSSVFLIPQAIAKESCETHEPCEIPALCECTVPAEGFYERYFYFDLYPLTQEHPHYACELTGSIPTIDLENSVFPEGVSYECAENCGHFPVKFTVNTTHMVPKEGVMEIRYYVPPSDIPTEVTAECRLISPNL